jgi:hypothetical protein
MRNITYTLAIALSLTAAAAPAFAADVVIVNESARTIEHVYVSSVRANQWGPDQLTNKVVVPHERFTLFGIQPGNYDLKLLMADKQECTIQDAHLSGDEVWTITNRHC